MFSFRLDATSGSARAGVFDTPHGPVRTPVFMPVGTVGAVKMLTPDEVRALGGAMILANTYHLFLRPGAELIRELGGLHRFMRWDGPILTDSGGYQVFSLAGINRIHDDGVDFQSHIDGSRHTFTPERVMDIQRLLGADVVMAFDECPPGGASRRVVERANERTIRWLERCRTRFDQRGEGEDGPRQALFPVLQGNVYDDLRREQATRVLDMDDWTGLGIGGLSVGESKVDMWRTLEVLDGILPTDRPRYLMGVGYPDDLLEGVSRGVDMFDCVAPTRNARHGTAWTLLDGQVNVKAARFRRDTRPLDPGCGCPTCATFDRAYLRHLIAAKERLGQRLISAHNLFFLLDLMRRCRERIQDGTLKDWSNDWLERYRSSSDAS